MWKIFPHNNQRLPGVRLLTTLGGFSTSECHRARDVTESRSVALVLRELESYALYRSREAARRE